MRPGTNTLSLHTLSGGEKEIKPPHNFADAAGVALSFSVPFFFFLCGLRRGGDVRGRTVWSGVRQPSTQPL